MALVNEVQDFDSDVDILPSSTVHLRAIQQAGSIEEALRLARDAILYNHRTNQQVEVQCALNITGIWQHIEYRKLLEPHNTPLIDRWSNDIKREISQVKIDHYQSLAAESQRRISGYENRIHTNWGVEPNPTPGCRAHVTLDKARALLYKEIRDRTHSKTTRRVATDAHLKLRDVMKALEAAGVKKKLAPAKECHSPKKRPPSPNGSSVSGSFSPLGSIQNPAGLSITADHIPRLDPGDTASGSNGFKQEGNGLGSRMDLNSSNTPLDQTARSASNITQRKRKTYIDLSYRPTAKRRKDSRLRTTYSLEPASHASDVPLAATRNSNGEPHRDWSAGRGEPQWMTLRQQRPNTPIDQARVTLERSTAAEMTPPSVEHPRGCLPPNVYHDELNSRLDGSNVDDSAILLSASPHSPIPPTPPISPLPWPEQIAGSMDGSADESSITHSDDDPIDTAQKTTQASEYLPTTDEAGAVESLKDRQLISATAIQIILSRVFPCKNHLRIVDPDYIDMENPSSITQKPPLRLAQNLAYLLIPLHAKNRWSLCTVDVLNRIISYYDSLPNMPSLSLARKALLIFIERQAIDSNISAWSFKNMPSAHQNNFFDCGVYTLVNALYLVKSDFAPLDLTMPIDCDLWRAVFRSLVSGKASKYPDGMGQAQAAVVSAVKQQRQIGTESIQNALAHGKSSLVAAKTSLQRSQSILNLLNIEFVNIRQSLNAATEEISNIEGCLSTSDHSLSKLDTHKTTQQKVIDIMRTAHDRVRQETKLLRRQMEANKGALGSLKAAIECVVHAHNIREKHYNQVKVELTAKLREAQGFWQQQQAIARDEEKRCHEELSSLESSTE
ncbi:MAG: hypothetical protein Q9213_001834 [Squamulea squamosa]